MPTMFGTPFRRGTHEADTSDLTRDRARNDRKLKGRLEHIFEKYNKDFTEVGDEIDLRTGRVVVDNGHLERMQNERDTGSSASRRFVKAFAKELGTEDHAASRTPRPKPRLGSHRNSGPSVAEEWEDEETGSSDDELNSSPTRPSTPSRRPTKQKRALATQAPSSSALVPSMQAQQTTRPVDPDAINSLGAALATQIATFLNQQLGAQLGGRTDPWSHPPLPSHVTPFPRQRDESPAPYSEGLRSPSPMAGLSLWAPYDDRRLPYGDPRGSNRYNDSIRLDDDDDIAMETIEHHSQSLARPYALDYGDQDNETDRDHQRGADHMDMDDSVATRESANMGEFDDFWKQATWTFQTLAHGIANRGQVDSLTDRMERRPDVTHRPLPRHIPLMTTQRPRVQTRSEYLTNRFTVKEDSLIIKLKERRGLTWPEIAQYFPHRTEISLALRYSRSLKAGSTRFKEGRITELDTDEEEIIEMPMPQQKGWIVEANESPARDFEDAEALEAQDHGADDESVADSEDHEPEISIDDNETIQRKAHDRQRKHPKLDGSGSAYKNHDQRCSSARPRASRDPQPLEFILYDPEKDMFPQQDAIPPTEAPNNATTAPHTTNLPPLKRKRGRPSNAELALRRLHQQAAQKASIQESESRTNDAPNASSGERDSPCARSESVTTSVDIETSRPGPRKARKLSSQAGDIATLRARNTRAPSSPIQSHAELSPDHTDVSSRGGTPNADLNISGEHATFVSKTTAKPATLTPPHSEGENSVVYTTSRVATPINRKILSARRTRSSPVQRSAVLRSTASIKKTHRERSMESSASSRSDDIPIDPQLLEASGGIRIDPRLLDASDDDL